MDTAFSVSLAGVLDTFVAKSPGDMEIGSYLGFYFIPLHGVGLYLVYVATRPASRALSVAVLTGGLYVTALGTAVHASLVYVGIVSRAGDPASIDAMARFFDVAAYSMVVLILIVAVGAAAYEDIAMLAGERDFRLISRRSPRGHRIVAQHAFQRGG